MKPTQEGLRAFKGLTVDSFDNDDKIVLEIDVRGYTGRTLALAGVKTEYLSE